MATAAEVALRPFRRADAKDLLVLWLDAEVARWTGVPSGPTAALARAWIETRPGREAAGRGIDRVVTVGAAFAGCVALDRADLSWWASWSVLPAYRGRGVATAAARLLLAEAPGPVAVDVDPTNVASVRVAEKLGLSITTTSAGPGR